MREKNIDGATNINAVCPETPGRANIPRDKQSVRDGHMHEQPMPFANHLTGRTDIASKLSFIGQLSDSSPPRAAGLMRSLQRGYGNSRLQRALSIAAKGDEVSEVSPETENAIHNAKGSGQGLNSSFRSRMEPAFGADFSNVRVHTGPQADALSQSLSARAFTAGRDIFFRDGEYNTESSDGQELLAHELTHVVQQGEGIRGKFTVSRPDDKYEREADLVARSVMSRRLFSREPSEDEKSTRGESNAFHACRQIDDTEEAEEEGEPVRAADAGASAVRRKIVFATGGTPPWREMTLSERRAFIVKHAARWGNKADGWQAARIIDDMAAASNDLRYDNEDELVTEIRKRIVTSNVMKTAQIPPGGLSAFAYPFRGHSRYFGPRVNYAARDFWEPKVPDNYGMRRDPARRRQLDAVGTDNEKAAVYGDPTKPYEFRLSTAGKKDPYNALISLFTPQPDNRKTLIHCDYFVSLVHYRAFADSLTSAEFNRRVQAGIIPMVLRWNGFDDIRYGMAAAGSTHLQSVIPNRREDLIIGDHVYFYNHKAYDVLIERVGGVWRLENAILVDRIKGVDYFLGHGSGYRDEDGIKGKLLKEYNDHVVAAQQLIRETETGTATRKAQALAKLTATFPGVVKKGNTYFIVGVNREGINVDEELKILKIEDIPGLYRPATYKSASNPGTFYDVRRPVESR